MIQYKEAPAPTKGDLGNLSNLETTAKSSAVAAINEVANSMVNFALVKTSFASSTEAYNEVDLPIGFSQSTTVIVSAITSNQYGTYFLNSDNHLIRIKEGKIGIKTSDSGSLNQTVYVMIAQMTLT